MSDPATAVPALTARMAHGDPEVRRTTVEMLGFVGGRAAVDALCHALEDPSPDVGTEAARALGALGDSRAASALTEAAARAGADPELGAAIAHALGRLSRQSSAPAASRASAPSRAAAPSPSPRATPAAPVASAALDRGAFCWCAACGCWTEETTVLPSTPSHRDDETSRRPAGDGAELGGRTIRRLA